VQETYTVELLRWEGPAKTWSDFRGGKLQKLQKLENPPTDHWRPSDQPSRMIPIHRLGVQHDWWIWGREGNPQRVRGHPYRHFNFRLSIWTADWILESKWRKAHTSDSQLQAGVAIQRVVWPKFSEHAKPTTKPSKECCSEDDIDAFPQTICQIVWTRLIRRLSFQRGLYKDFMVLVLRVKYILQRLAQIRGHVLKHTECSQLWLILIARFASWCIPPKSVPLLFKQMQTV